MTDKLTVKADMIYDPGHVVDYDFDNDREIVEGRWLITIVTPEGEVERLAKTPWALVAFAERWGKDRGVLVDLKFLSSLGARD